MGATISLHIQKLHWYYNWRNICLRPFINSMLERTKQFQPHQTNLIVRFDAIPSHNRCAFWGAAVLLFMALQFCQPRQELVVIPPRAATLGFGRD